MAWRSEIPFFKAHELECKGKGTIKIDRRFAIELPYLRKLWGSALFTNSVCRTPSHNKAVGGHPRSLHLTENPEHPTDGAMAADIRWRDWDENTQLSFSALAYALGWSAGLHDGFCHVDRRKDIGLRQNVFLYGEWSGTFTPDDVKEAAKEVNL